MGAAGGPPRDVRARPWIAAGPALAWLGAFLFAPLVLVTITSLRGSGVGAGNVGGAAGAAGAAGPDAFTLHHYARALASPFREVIVGSLGLAALASLFCLFVAFPVAWFVATRPARRRGAWLAVFLVPFLLNFLVRIYAWFILLRPEGWLARLAEGLGFEGLLTSTRASVVLGLVYSYLPFLVLPLYGVLEKLDGRLLEAARDLGAGPWARFRHVVLPHARPGIVAGLVLVFVPMMGEYCVPRMLGGGMVPTLGTQIESQFLGGVRPNWPFGSALSVVLVALVGVALVVGARLGAKLLDGERAR